MTNPLGWKLSTVALLGAFLATSGTANAADRAQTGAVNIAHVLLISVDGMHDVDLSNYVAAKPQSTLAQLVRGGVRFTGAKTPIPSDSYPGLLALVTGGTPRSTGIYYDEFYDRALSPANASRSCATVGATIRFDKTIDLDPARIDGGGGIDPTKLPRDPQRGCAPLYPHDAIRVNTIFEVIKAGGGRTAWSDKHLAYEIVNGPSGTGVDDLFDPEIAANNVSATIGATEDYDDLKVRAVRNEIRGFDHTGSTRVPVPVVFGMNFQSVTTAQVTAGNGYLDASGTPGPGLAGAFDSVDRSLGAMLAALGDAGLRSSTAVIVTAKHGQSPIDPAKRRYVATTFLNDVVTSVAPGAIVKQNQGDGALLWLSERSKTDAVARALRANADAGGILEVLSGPELAAALASPLTDSRAPDLLVHTVPGVMFMARTRIAAHGGVNDDDRSVALLVVLPGAKQAVVADPVSTTQVAPTILKLLGFDPAQLKAVRIEGTRALRALPYRSAAFSE